MAIAAPGREPVVQLLPAPADAAGRIRCAGQREPTAEERETGTNFASELCYVGDVPPGSGRPILASDTHGSSGGVNVAGDSGPKTATEFQNGVAGWQAQLGTQYAEAG